MCRDHQEPRLLPGACSPRVGNQRLTLNYRQSQRPESLVNETEVEIPRKAHSKVPPEPESAALPTRRRRTLFTWDVQLTEDLLLGQQSLLLLQVSALRPGGPCGLPRAQPRADCGQSLGSPSHVDPDPQCAVNRHTLETNTPAPESRPKPPSASATPTVLRCSWEMPRPVAHVPVGCFPCRGLGFPVST